MFEGNDSIWWITGGYYAGSDLHSTEVFNAEDESFTRGINLPKEMSYHNLVNVNSTHMVVLGGIVTSDEIFIFDRYTVYKIMIILNYLTMFFINKEILNLGLHFLQCQLQDKDAKLDL